MVFNLNCIFINMMQLPNARKSTVGLNGYMQQLETKGYQLLGSGAFANIYGKPKGRTVIKIGNVNGDSYLRYVERIGLRNTNPHVPYITSIKIFDIDPNNPLSKPFYVIRMEKLDDVLSTYRPDDQMQDHMDSIGIKDVEALVSCNIGGVIPLTKEFSEVVTILKDLYSDMSIACDLCDKNVLWRRRPGTKQLVVTDPIV